MRRGLEQSSEVRRLLRHPVGVVGDLAVAFQALTGGGDGFWLHSGTPDPARPGAAARHYLGAGKQVAVDGMVLDALRAELADLPPAADEDAPDFRLGLVGWLEYELRGETLGPSLPLDHPPARLLRVDRALAVDAMTGEGELLALGTEWQGELASWRDAALTAFASHPPAEAAADRSSSAGTGRNGPIPRARRAGRAVYLDDDSTYLERIRACQAAIVEGEVYQLCLTTQIELTDRAPDPLVLFERLRASSPAHHAGLLRIGDTTLVSASPERFLAADRQGRLSTSPIKGTRPRAADPAEDARLAADLLASEKERAENLMIVDLMRNDLSRVCTPGSVEVTSMLKVETYAQVHQLVSTVEGRLAAGRTVIDALAVCFPAGSMTGVPKRRATELLAALEGRPRGVYSGAFGWIGLDGACDLAMVIRSIVLGPDGASLGAGGGITALSTPADELAEMKLKAAPLIAALGAS